MQQSQHLNPLFGSFPGLGSSLLSSRGGSPQTAGATPDDATQENGGGLPPPHTQLPHQADTQRDTSHTSPIKKKTRANILLATLNIKGRTSTLLGNNNDISKWSALHHVMRKKKIGLLCIQETHLLPEHEAQIESLYSKRIRVLNSRDPFRPGNSAGVAFVINKEILNADDLKTHEIIPGRASVLRLKWHNETYLTIANIYAPNNHAQHPNFWNTIGRLWRENNIPNPDFLMGDFNITEDALDRAPARLDNEQAIEALRNLRFQLNIQDSWRINNPTMRSFMFYSNTNSHSHLDRIYSSPTHELSICGWDSCTSAIPTDHRMILVRYVPTNTPFVGTGRWSLLQYAQAPFRFFFSLPLYYITIAYCRR
jgi:exonuclease III